MLDILDTGTYARHSRYLCETFQILILDIPVQILTLDIPYTYARHIRYLR